MSESVSEALHESALSPTPAQETSLPRGSPSEEDGDLTDAPPEVPSHASPKLSSLPHTPEPTAAVDSLESAHESEAAESEKDDVEEEEEKASVHSEKDETPSAGASEAEAGTRTDDEEPRSKADDDLADIVNLLESGGPPRRPVSIVDIPRDMKDIPDED